MALVFYEVHVPDGTKRDHARAGGKELAARKATVNDGPFLRVWFAKEPMSFEAEAPLQPHVSISVGPELGEPHRRATDEECKEALSLWPLIDFAEDPDVGGRGSLVRHFYEKGGS